MSGSQPTSAGGGSGSDPSMEDILASIRRILSEDEPQPAEAPPAPEEAGESDVLILDSSMEAVQPEPAPASMADNDVPEEVIVPPEPPVAMAAPTPAQPVSSTPPKPEPVLVAPEIAAAAASAVGGLLRTLASERSTRVHSSGPTLEDLVREEMRPLLKHWLDTHLPEMVERLVHAEIERVVRRAVP